MIEILRALQPHSALIVATLGVVSAILAAVAAWLRLRAAFAAGMVGASETTLRLDWRRGLAEFLSRRSTPSSPANPPEGDEPPPRR